MCKRDNKHSFKLKTKQRKAKKEVQEKKTITHSLKNNQSFFIHMHAYQYTNIQTFINEEH